MLQTATLNQHHRRLEDLTPSPLGHRRRFSNVARVSLDLPWVREEAKRAVRTTDYPSPPMSGSPPLPPKPTQEAGDRGQGSQQARIHDAYRGASITDITTAHGADSRRQPLAVAPHAHPAHSAHPEHQYQHHQQHPLHHQHPPPPPHSSSSLLSRSYPPEPPSDRLPYSPYAHLDEPSGPRPLSSLPSYPPLQQPGSTMTSYPHYLPPLPGPGSMQQGYPASSPRPPPPAQIPSPAPGAPGSSEGSQAYGSPKSQRKTKGHVASACVPCKRAHLRCDAQRPCSRCLSNGKEDACVDVQHKKRGRPRLREERDLRYDISGRGGPGGQPTEMPIRRPAPILYGQPSASMGSGFIERGSAADANIYPAPLSITTHAPEPAAFLSLDLEIANASGTFVDAVGRQTVKGLSLLDVVSGVERDKVLSLQRQMQEERERKDPRYLPPIFAKRDEERLLQSLGFAPEDLARFSLDWQDYLTFHALDGQQRTFPVRIGLAKQDSIYFIVLVLHIDMRHLGHPTPSPQSRDMPYSYQPMQQQPPPPPQSMYSQPTPVSATFDVNRPRVPSDASFGPPRPPPSGGQMLPGVSPGLPSAYAASPSRLDYPGGLSSYQTPRSELGSRPQPPPPPPPQTGYQLPPIRSHHESRPLEYPTSTRDDKSRVDIGGLIDKPEPSSRMHR